MVVAFLLVFFCLVVVLLYRKKKTPEKRPQPAPGTGIPEGMESLYQYGVDPRSGDVPVMYTLHTCRHCVRLKDFLDKRKVRHVLVYVDDFADPARKELMNTLRSYNPRGSFPTLVVPDGRSVVGFREEAVKAMLGLN